MAEHGRLLLFAALAVLAAGAAHAARPPVVFVPGLTSSFLQFQKDSPFRSRFTWCKNTTTQWQLMWPPQRDDTDTLHDAVCWLEEMQVQYNSRTRQFIEPPGMQTSRVDFGGFNGVNGGPSIVAAYTQQGWTVGRDLFCAPFDWRYSAAGQGLASYYTQLMQLIEQASNTTAQRVVLAAASFGPQVALSFLQHMTPAWKARYISWFIAESPVWSGSVIAPSVLAAGEGSNITEMWTYRELALGAPAMMWLFPRAGTTNTTWGRTEPLIRTPARNYTAYDYETLLHDLGFSDHTAALQTILDDPALGAFAAPGVDTFVTYGYGLPTPGMYEFSEAFKANATWMPPPPRVVMAPETGDHIVPLRSSVRAKYAWAAAQRAAGKQLYYKGYSGQPHAQCLFPQSGACFHDVLALIINGTVPHAEADQAPVMQSVEDAPAGASRLLAA